MKGSAVKPFFFCVLILCLAAGTFLFPSLLSANQKKKEIGVEDMEEIPRKGLFVEYQPPPVVPPTVTMLNTQTGKVTKGVEVLRRWIKDGKLENVTLADPLALHWPSSLPVSEISNLQWNLHTTVAPKLVELYIVDSASFDPLKLPRELKHVASCGVNGDNFEGRLPLCSSWRDEDGQWVIATPIQHKVKKPLKVILTAWWQYLPDAFLSNPDPNKEFESEVFWGTWIFTLPGLKE